MTRGSTADRRCWRIAAALLVLAACQDMGDVAAERNDDPPVARDPASLAETRFKAVLVAGDSAQPVFDNATSYLHDRLIAAGVAEENIHRLSAADRPRGAAEPATLTAVRERIAGLTVAAGEGCLVFLSSHGHPKSGFVLARSREFLTPAQLDRALSAGCGEAPTIVVVSSCFSGAFAKPPMARANRIVLTAARPDRPSFGCGAGYTYNTFDQCFLGSLDGAATWQIVFERTRGCVATRESVMRETPSEPQAYFGSAVGAMPAPWRALSGDAARIEFVPGTERFTPEGVPLLPRERARLRKSFEHYAEAPAPKAFALSPDGAFGWFNRSDAGPHTAADAARMALQTCEWFGGACTLYAVNDAVVAPLPSGLAPFHPSILVRSGPLDPASVPFIRDDQRPSIDDYLARPAPKVLVLGVDAPVIAYEAGASRDVARSEAWRRCRAITAVCVVYAEDETVVLGYAKR
jgi:hypothetical protein